MPAENFDQLFLDDLDKGLIGTEALEHLGAHGTLFDLLDELTHHGQRHISLQQRDTYVAQRFADVFLADLVAATDFGHGRRQAVRKRLEHHNIPGLKTGR